MKRDYYCLLTNGYETQECQTMEEVFQKIENCLKKNNLSYEKIFDRCDGKMQVIVYQYSTLYMETFIIHGDYNLTK